MADLVEVDGVRKAFPGVVALDGVSMRVRPGTVHALIGENGAGQIHADEDASPAFSDRTPAALPFAGARR